MVLSRRQAILGGASTLLGLTGCSKTFYTNTTGGRTVIRSSFWGMVQDARMWQQLAKTFNEKQNKIEVKLEQIIGQTYHPKIYAMTVGNCAPDVIVTDDEPFRFLSDNGAYYDLTPYVGKGDIPPRSAFYEAPYNTFEINKKQFAIPYMTNCLLIYVNKDHRRAAGLSPDPDPNWDWETYTKDAIALTKDLDNDGRPDQFGVNRCTWFYCMQWVWGAGGTDMNPERTSYIMDSPEARKGFQLHYDQMHVHKVCPLVSDLPNMNWESMFLTGKVSMFMTGSWWLSQARLAKAIDWDIYELPFGPIKRATRATSEGLALSAQSKNKEAGWEWIKFLLSDEGQTIIAKYGRGIPVIREVAPRTFPRADSPQHEERCLKAMEYSHITGIHARWIETEQVFNREWDRLTLNEIDVDGFLKNSIPEANTIVRGEAI